jgi:hypothetical protein
LPTYSALERFLRDYDNLSATDHRLFITAVSKLVTDLRMGQLRAGLRVNRVQNHPGVWEMTWAPDGRATFEYGEAVRKGEPHIVWRRIGTHDIFGAP